MHGRHHNSVTLTSGKKIKISVICRNHVATEPVSALSSGIVNKIIQPAYLRSEFPVLQLEPKAFLEGGSEPRENQGLHVSQSDKIRWARRSNVPNHGHLLDGAARRSTVAVGSPVDRSIRRLTPRRLHWSTARRLGAKGLRRGQRGSEDHAVRCVQRRCHRRP